MLLGTLYREMRPLYSDDTGGDAQGAAAAETTDATTTETAADDFDKERAMATIRQQRAEMKEAKAKLKRLEELETAEETRKSADLSELDRLRKEHQTLAAEHQRTQAALRTARIKDAARNAAQGLSLTFQPGALDDAVALGVFADLELDDDGKVLGLNDALKALQKARPYLFGQPQKEAPDINAGARGNGAGEPYMTTEEKARATAHYRHTF